jgi:hypothetical protein
VGVGGGDGGPPPSSPAGELGFGRRGWGRHPEVLYLPGGTGPVDFADFLKENRGMVTFFFFFFFNALAL